MAVWHRHWAGRGGWGPVHRWHSTSSGLSGIPSVTLGSDLTALGFCFHICKLGIKPLYLAELLRGLSELMCVLC